MGKRILVWAYIVGVMFIVFFLRLWDLQIVKGGEYKRLAEQNRLRVIEIPAPRGVIYDRNDIPLVRNIPSFDISVVREDLPQDPESLAAIGRLIGLSAAEIEDRVEKGGEDPFGPVKLKQDVSFEEVARVEARRVDFPGLQVEVVISRDYIYGELASHVIGYLGRLTLEQARDPDYAGVPMRAFIGQRGIEKVYDRVLRGTAGEKIIEVDARGRVIKVAGIQPPVKGEDLKLTIDLKLQSEAEDALGGRAGAVVALDANSGEVLVMASTPAFDPNLFARGINYSDWKRLARDPKKPFLNRALQSQYPPGSTFKIISALAALEQGIIKSSTRYQCRGSIDIGGRVFKCWKEQGHGSTDLYKAIVESCDVYFYEIAKKIGIDTLSKYATDFGLGSPTGIELAGERSGIVPSAEWKLRTKKEKWFTGETLNTVIGQGYLSTTPIQMARLMSAVVNGGRLNKPHLLKGQDDRGKAGSTVNISPENTRVIKKALMGVVADKTGTGRRAASDIVSIGGKTGTTQVVGGKKFSGKDIPERYRDHAWFVAFAPEDKPEIAIAVFVEHGGHGSTAAAPIAKRVIEKYFKKEVVSTE
ncbi:MAG TPA: penicillin-binding protein 2 [Nitrospirae bacterium]|nr:stage V sporulation protein D [bacterium BMS3Abin10]GBE39755.1 stage V sporulation protein D [bacterium BMS3Bbin08]HDH50921.1 penicillin-binding protein 2 [Nitrospirota bacterium]HDK16523.1 penicillin-binding protein 2 [Nitrospirota bacterium]HDK82101.1 penicillin-binding protein 2 [Nitrospirota bacterium]